MNYYKFDQNNLTYIKVNWISKLSRVIIPIIILFFILGFNFKFKPNQQYNEQEILLIVENYNKFDKEKLINEIKSKNYKFPYIVYAQAILETGNFKSKIFIENNNLFGMKLAKSRITTAAYDQYNHAYYKSWKESLEDYGYFYSQYLSKLNTEEQYFQYLSQYYAENPNYVNNLINIINNNNLKNLFN